MALQTVTWKHDTWKHLKRKHLTQHPPIHEGITIENQRNTLHTYGHNPSNIHYESWKHSEDIGKLIFKFSQATRKDGPKHRQIQKKALKQTFTDLQPNLFYVYTLSNNV